MYKFHTSDSDKWVIYQQTKGKKLILFGTGEKARKFIAFHDGNVHFDMVIDNDLMKQNNTLDTVIKGILDYKTKKLIIKPVENLNNFDDDDVFIFIANAKPEQLISQLKTMGKTNFLTYREWEKNQEELPFKQNINKKKIIFFMFMHGAHEKEITKQLLRYRSDLDIVWVVSGFRKDAPIGVRMILADNMFDCRYEAASACVWVTGLEILDEYLKKRDGQHYIQVKHWSSLTLKVFGPECNKNVVSEEVYRNITEAYEMNNKKIDIVFSGSEFDEQSCRKGWNYDGSFIRVGSPRTDIMFHLDSGKKVYSYLGVDENIHLAMYAPTFRWPHGQENPLHDIDLYKLYHSLKERFSEEWKIMLRLHPLVAEQAKDIVLPSFVINMSEYDDSEELAAAADVTITDFSSIMFEPAFVYKPVFLYAPDKKKYQKEHPLLLDYDKLPFPVCMNNEELVNAILEYDENNYRYKLSRFFDKYGVHEDGHASERAAMYILGLLDAKG